MLLHVNNIAFATRFDRANAERALAHYERVTGPCEGYSVQPCGDAFVIATPRGWLRHRS